MVRARKAERTRRKHAAARHKRTSIGQPQPSLDWHCPYCFQWFSQKRNGPSNHLRFCCAARHSHRSEPRAGPAEQTPIVSPLVALGSGLPSGKLPSPDSGTTSDNSSESDSDTPLIRRRCAKWTHGLRAEDSGKSQTLISTSQLC
jgi:hypothetical protein